MAAHRNVKPPSRRTQRKADRAASLVTFDALCGWPATEPGRPAGGPAKLAALGKGLTAATVIGLLLATLTLPFIGAGAITVREADDYWNNLPSDLPDLPLPQRSVILAADDSRIAEFYSENRVLVSLKQVPAVVRDAVVSIEDSRFYDHHGIDPRGTSRALANNLLGGDTQGGSTLTQQYIKNVLMNAADTAQVKREVTSRTSYLRKLREAKLAIELEKRLTKDQILEGYLNIAYFGDGAYGIGTAAKHYFNKPVARLNLPEAALLAGLVQNPTGYDPTNAPGAARDRRATVLFRMRQLDAITAQQYRRAVAAPIRLDLTSPTNGCHASKFPLFCQWVKTQLEQDPVFGATGTERQQRLFSGGMVIRTTLDPDAQRVAQAAVDRALGRDNRVAAASVTVQPGSGHVTAMAVNRSFGQPRKGSFAKTEMLLPVMPEFQPGSNFKPFTLAAALERGFDPATPIAAPAVYAPAGMNYPGYGFENSGSAATGTLTAAQAIWRSSNTWFVRLEEQVGVLNVASMAERLGITSLPRTGDRAITERDASLTLGAYEVSPLEMAGAYAAFAAHGTHCTPIGVTSITGPDGTPVATPDSDCHEAIPAGVADTIATIMQGTIDGPDPYRTGKQMTLGRPAAGKTGTTQNNAAVWFSGFTPQYATSVWVGDPRGGFAHPLHGFYAYGQFIDRAYGGVVAGPIWKDIMLGIHRGLPEQAFTPPTGATGYANVAPDVRNLTLAQACQVLTAAGFDVALNRTLADSDPLLAKNRVFGTDPAPGSLVGLGTTIAITMTAGSDLDVTFDGASPGHDGDPHASNPDDSGTPDGDDGSVTAAGGPARDLGGGIVTPSTGVTPRPGHGTKPH